MFSFSCIVRFPQDLILSCWNPFSSVWWYLAFNSFLRVRHYEVDQMLWSLSTGRLSCRLNGQVASLYIEDLPNVSIWRSFIRDHSVSSGKTTPLSCLEDMVLVGEMGRGRGSFHHWGVGFHLISLFPAPCLTPLPTIPGVPHVWSLSGSFFSIKYFLSLPGVEEGLE